MKRVSFLAALLLLISVLTVRAEIIASGYCGTVQQNSLNAYVPLPVFKPKPAKNIKWTLSDDGILTIDGSEEMQDWFSENQISEHHQLRFYRCPWSKYSDKIKRVMITGNVSNIGSNSFNGCQNLTSISLPESIEIIGDSAFSHCSNLSHINFPKNVISIGQNAFYGCYSLTDIVLPEGVTVYHEAFAYCGFHEITIPANIDLYGNTFHHCDKLTKVTLGKGVYSRNNIQNIFAGCNNLTDTIYPEKKIIPDIRYPKKRTITDIRWELSDDGILTLTGEGDINYLGRDDTSYYTYRSEFPWSSQADKIQKVVIGGNIESCRFAECKYLSEVVILEGVTKLYSSTFSGCSELKKITLPNSLKEIGAYAFKYCSKLQSIAIPEGTESIGEDVFRGCERLLQVSLPASLKEIGIRAFAYAPMSEIIIPEGVQSIGKEAFIGCDYLTSVKIPASVTYVGENAFSECNSLNSVSIIGNKSRVCEGYTFSSCRNLTEVSIVGDATYIETGAFSYCYRLAKISLPEGLTRIAGGVFYNVDSMKTITLPRSLKYIESLPSITELTIPKNVTDIKGRMTLASIVYLHCKPVVPPYIDRNAFIQYRGFEEMTYIKRIYVPKESLDAYRRAPYWRDYADIIVGE